MIESYGIELDKLFKFSSSHFAIGKGFRETLHGHNYNVSIKLYADQLNECYYVIDFGLVKEISFPIFKELNNFILLPKLNPFLTISESGKNIEIM